MRTQDDRSYINPGWDAFSSYYGPVAAERCQWAVFMARATGSDIEAAVDAALVALDRERNADA